MIVGRHPRNPMIGDTVLARNEFRRGWGTIVGSGELGHRVYWRDCGGMVSWHARRELVIPRLDYGKRI